MYHQWFVKTKITEYMLLNSCLKILEVSLEEQGIPLQPHRS